MPRPSHRLLLLPLLLLVPLGVLKWRADQRKEWIIGLSLPRPVTPDEPDGSPITDSPPSLKDQFPLLNDVADQRLLPPPPEPTATPRPLPPQVFSSAWLHQQSLTTTYLYAGNSSYDPDPLERRRTGFREREGIEITNRQSIQALMQAFHDSPTLPTSYKLPNGPRNEIVTITLFCKEKHKKHGSEHDMTLFEVKGQYYLEDFDNSSINDDGMVGDAVGHDGMIKVDGRSLTRFLRVLRGAVAKGRRKQRGYSVGDMGT